MIKPMEVIASKAHGIRKMVDARRHGLVGVFQTLAQQHGEVAALIDRVRKDPSKREGLWPDIKIALLAHEHAELEAVYPALERFDALKPFVKQHAAEATELEQIIERLDAASPKNSAPWGVQFDSLAKLVLAHVAEEEEQIFPAAIQEMGATHVNALEGEYKVAFTAAKSALKAAVKH